MLRRLIGGFMPPYKDKQNRIVPNSISTLEKLTIGDVEQWITIRGKDKELPILLFFHGGPGTSQVGVQQKYNSELEEHFIVVNWDQRGSGKSFSQAVTVESMNLNQLLEDADELVLYLIKKFNKKKIFLMGHSFGAALGLLFAHRYPELLYSYVSINQPIQRENEEKRSYEYVLQVAKDNSNRRALKQLEKIGAPTHGVYGKTSELVVQRKWLTKFNGVTFDKNATLINLNCLMSTHLTFLEKLNFFKRFGFSATHLWREFMSLNFFNLVPELKIPIFFIAGKHDRITYAELIKEYFHYVVAEDKHLFIFEDSGHLSCFEEAAKFNQLMLQQVLPIYYR
ncbi:putative hydrolase [Bacillus sp. TS-2]|nr:putative hydrolase [Bacillus sp. TS-2]